MHASACAVMHLQHYSASNADNNIYAFAHICCGAAIMLVQECIYTSSDGRIPGREALARRDAFTFAVAPVSERERMRTTAAATASVRSDRSHHELARTGRPFVCVRCTRWVCWFARMSFCGGRLLTLLCWWWWWWRCCWWCWPRRCRWW